MNKTIILSVLTTLISIGTAHGVGDYPVPQITDVTFGVQVDYDASTGRYTYQYRIASGPDNIGTMSMIFIDIKRKWPTYAPSA